MSATKAAKATKIKKVGAKVISTKVGEKSKTHDPMCSGAMSAWKGGGTLTSEIAKVLAKCRNKARLLRGQKTIGERKLAQRLISRSLARHEIQGKKFGESKAKVVFQFPEHQTKVKKLFKQITGQEYSDAKIASLAGTPDHINVSAYPTGVHGSVKIIIKSRGEGFDSVRTIEKGKDGVVIMHNEFFEIGKGLRGKGLGSEVFGRQVENARKMGIKEIHTSAARSDDPGYEMNGYYTWPRLGYDGPVPSHIKSKIPSHIHTEKSSDGRSVNVSSLMKTKEGREWWKKNGTSFDATFDLKPGSESLKAFEHYINNKQ